MIKVFVSTPTTRVHGLEPLRVQLAAPYTGRHLLTVLRGMENVIPKGSHPYLRKPGIAVLHEEVINDGDSVELRFW